MKAVEHSLPGRLPAAHADPRIVVQEAAIDAKAHFGRNCKKRGCLGYGHRFGRAIGVLAVSRVAADEEGSFLFKQSGLMGLGGLVSCAPLGT